MQLLELDDFAICAIINAIDDEDIFHFANTCRTLKKLSIGSISQRTRDRTWEYIHASSYREGLRPWTHPTYRLHATNTMNSSLHLVQNITYNLYCFKINSPLWFVSDRSARSYKMALEHADEIERLLLGLPFLNREEKAVWIRDLKTGCPATALVVLIALCPNTKRIFLHFKDENPEEKRTLFTKLSRYINFQRLSCSLPKSTNIRESCYCKISYVQLADCMVADVIEVLKVPTLRGLHCEDIDDDAESSWKTTWEAEVKNNTLVERVYIGSLDLRPATVIEFCCGMPALRWLRFGNSEAYSRSEFLEFLVKDHKAVEQRLWSGDGSSLASIGMTVSTVLSPDHWFVHFSRDSTGAST